MPKHLFRFFIFCISALLLSFHLSANKLDSLKSLLKKPIDDSSRIIILNHLADENMQSNLDTALYFARKAEELASAINNKPLQISSLRFIGDAYRLRKDLSASGSQYMKALKLAEELKSTKSIWLLLNNIGNLHFDARKFSLALSYFKEAERYSENTHDTLGLRISYQNISATYYNLKDYNTGMAYTNKALEICRLQKDSCHMVGLINNKNDMLLAQGKNREALNGFYTALKLNPSCPDTFVLSVILLNIGYCYDSLHVVDSAITYFNNALSISSRFTDKDVFMEVSKALSKEYSKRKEYAKAYTFLNNVYMLRDSLFNVQADMQSRETQSRYEAQQKDIEIAILNKEQEKQLIIEIALLLGATLLVILLLLIYSRYRLRKKASTQMQDSIDYAKKIQDSILPKTTTVKQLFPDSFILFKPKDVVSGDFYWVSQRGTTSYVAVADCTGHGVPGAFLSMIGTILLNEIINELGVYKPAKVLNLLREGLANALHNKVGPGEAMDGIAISLVVIDTKNQKLNVSNAGQALYIVQDQEMGEIENMVPPIGEFAGDFTEQEMIYKTGSWIYLASDGYQDQQGGYGHKRFMRKQFKELLLSIHKLPAEEQLKELENKFYTWKQRAKQTDDILVFGIKL